jgi:hypothetical protein
MSCLRRCPRTINARLSDEEFYREWLELRGVK